MSEFYEGVEISEKTVTNVLKSRGY